LLRHGRKPAAAGAIVTVAVTIGWLCRSGAEEKKKAEPVAVRKTELAEEKKEDKKQVDPAAALAIRRSDGPFVAFALVGLTEVVHHKRGIRAPV
jgi:hypothetical protein